MTQAGPDESLTRGTEETETRAWTDCYAAAAARGLPARVHACGGAIQLVVPGTDTPLLNRVIGLSPDASDEVIGELLAGFALHRVSRFLLHERPGPRATELERRLDGHGIVRYRRDWVTLVRGDTTVNVPPPAVPVEHAREEDRPAMARVFAAGFDLAPGQAQILASVVGRPGWTSLVARDAGRVVATALMFTWNEAAHLVASATAPSHRRRGLQTALLARRIQLGLQAGVRRFHSETGTPDPGTVRTSHDNMVRMGFRPAHVRRNYAPRDMAWDHGRHVPDPAT